MNQKQTEIDKLITAAFSDENRVVYRKLKNQMFAVRYKSSNDIEFEQLHGACKRHSFYGRRDALQNFDIVFHI